MTTNPTPLTAEDVVDRIRQNNTLDYFKAADDIEAYAAQQNAELVAEANKDNVLIAQLHEEVADLQAENERLKQQLAWQPIETLPVHVPAEIYRTFKGGSHWFGVKTTLGSIGVHFGDDFIIVDDATHWRLPQPPKEAT